MKPSPSTRMHGMRERSALPPSQEVLSTRPGLGCPCNLLPSTPTLMRGNPTDLVTMRIVMWRILDCSFKAFMSGLSALTNFSNSPIDQHLHRLLGTQVSSRPGFCCHLTCCINCLRVRFYAVHPLCKKIYVQVTEHALMPLDA